MAGPWSITFATGVDASVRNLRSGRVRFGWVFLEDEANVYSSGVLGALYGGDHAIAPQIWAYELRNLILMAFRAGG